MWESHFATSVSTLFLGFVAAYKHADGKKIDSRRVLVDVERSRTVKGWRPRRLGKLLILKPVVETVFYIVRLMRHSIDSDPVPSVKD